MNPNYVDVVKHDLDKLLTTSSIAPMEEATWLLPIVVVPKKNGKLCICVDFKRLNVTKKIYPYLLPFIEEVLDMVAKHKVYSFLVRFFGHHQIMLTLKDRYKTAFITKWGTFIWLVMPFELKNAPPTY
jgi:hypothetical protein